MNCPSRPDDIAGHNDWNQSPNALAGDATTRKDLNGMATSRIRRDLQKGPEDIDGDDRGVDDSPERIAKNGPRRQLGNSGTRMRDLSNGKKFLRGVNVRPCWSRSSKSSIASPGLPSSTRTKRRPLTRPTEDTSLLRRAGEVLVKFGKFIGPGFMVSVAYIDPGNYSTDVAAGSRFRFRLLFVILMSNIFAIFLQSLCVKLGTVTGLNLAENCKAHLPRWLNLMLYVFAEAAIIATDIAEVIGSAIALNLLIHVPLVAGCAITLVDVLIILLFYSPNGSMRRLRAFEFFVMALVLGVVVCFCIQLSLIRNISVGEVFRGYLPSSTLVQSQGLYLSCGILGATVMPHSLYLGSGIVQSRLRAYDAKNATANALNPSTTPDSDPRPSTASSTFSSDTVLSPPYRPTLSAIRFSLNYSIAEIAISLFTFALFVNSAILIVAGASLSSNEDAKDANLFAIHDLLSSTLAPAAGTIFALALLLSGTSAGIVCTIAGQIVSEGALNWSCAPWMRRLITRSISITPSIIIAAAVGKNGLSKALNATQVVLSVLLPFISAPLIYFTCRNKYMTVHATRDDLTNSTQTERDIDSAASGPRDPTADGPEIVVKMRNHWSIALVAVLIWGVITLMNIALLVLIGMGKV